MTDDSIIDFVVESISDVSDTPIEFIKSGIYAVLAETIGSFYKLPNTLGSFKLLNLFNIIGSPPHMAHRSDLIRHMNKIVETALIIYHEKLDSTPERLDLDIEAHTLQAGGSTEGLIDEINKLYKKGIRSFLILDPEIGKTFDAMNKTGSHMSGTTDTLCRLFTRDKFVNYFSTKSSDEKEKTIRKLPTDISFSILGAMQNPEHYLTGKTAQVGMLRRLWINTLRGDCLPEYKPLITEKSKAELDNNLKTVGRRIGVIMGKLSDNKPHTKTLEWNKEVINEINSFDKEYVMYARNNDDDATALSKITFGEMCCKLAGIRAISFERRNITIEDITIAKELLRNSEKQTDLSLRNMELTDEQIEDDKYYKIFLGYIKEGLSLKTIQQRFSGRYKPVRGTDWSKLKETILQEYKYTRGNGWREKEC